MTPAEVIAAMKAGDFGRSGYLDMFTFLNEHGLVDAEDLEELEQPLEDHMGRKAGRWKPNTAYPIMAE